MKKSQTQFFTLILIIVIILVFAMGFLLFISQNEGGEEECEAGDEGHEGFEAFTLTVDAPSQVPDNYEFDYKLIVRDEWKHEVLGLEAVLDLSGAQHLEFTSGTPEPYHREESGSVSISSSSASFTFPVEENATSAAVIVDGDEGLIGLNNIDLNVYSPDGDMLWAVGSSGANPELTLSAEDLREGGLRRLEGRGCLCNRFPQHFLFNHN